MKYLLVTLLFSATASADGLSALDSTSKSLVPTCKILRQAQAIISLQKTSWQQNSGIWVQSSIEVGRITTEVPVQTGDSSGCPNNNIVINDVVLNGNPEEVDVNADIRVFSTGELIKRFTAGYWVSADNGRSALSFVDSFDLALQKINLGINIEAAANSTSAHQDWLSVVVTFNDNAQ